MTIGDRIFFIRNFRHLSREALAASVNDLVPNKKITADRIQKYENGHRNPREDVLQAIAKVLNVNYDTLSAPDVNPTNILSILFELENTLEITLENNEDQFSIIINKTEGKNSYDEINYDLNNWYAKRKECTPSPADSPETANRKIEEYKIWKTMYPLDTLENEKKVLKRVNNTYSKAFLKTQKLEHPVRTDSDFIQILVNTLLTGIDAHYIRRELAWGEQLALFSFKADSILSIADKSRDAFVQYLLCNQVLVQKYKMSIETNTHTDNGDVYIDYTYTCPELRYALYYVESTIKPYIKAGTFYTEDVQEEYLFHLNDHPTLLENIMNS